MLMTHVCQIQKPATGDERCRAASGGQSPFRINDAAIVGVLRVGDLEGKCRADVSCKYRQDVAECQSAHIASKVEYISAIIYPGIDLRQNGQTGISLLTKTQFPIKSVL